MLSLGVREMAAVLRVMLQGDLNRYTARGVSESQRFEDTLRSTVGTQHALAVNSGTSALICSLVGAGVGPGDEVLVPAYTWVSTAAAPLAVGAIPILVEIDASLTIDPADIRRKITPFTKAIIPVHMNNLASNMDAIMAIASEFNLAVIEDASQAVGVQYRGRYLGSIGHAGAYSFNQHKNIKAGEGGALVTNDPRLYDRAAMYHDVGHYERQGKVYTDEPEFVGVNFRMPEISAAMLRSQLKRLDDKIARLQLHRKIVLDALSSSSYRFTVSPHHDPKKAVGLAIHFEDAEEAVSFGAARGAKRLLDSGRHVYTNWQTIIAKRSAHPEMNPHVWARRDIDYSADACPATLDILAHTCTVELAPEIPTLLFRQQVRRLVQPRPRTAAPVATPVVGAQAASLRSIS